MDTLADEMDQVMARLERAGMERRAQAQQKERLKWLSDKRAPWAKLANENQKERPLPTALKKLQAWKETGALSAWIQQAIPVALRLCIASLPR